MNVLVVEDDPALGMFLQKGLTLEGHAVRWVGDGDAALEQVTDDAPDLMVLDLSLPRRDGTEVLGEMRALHPHTAVVVLTGRSQVEERVRCLNLGADDCLLKPFSFHELSARCRAVLRRREQFASPELHFAGVDLNLLERSARFEGVPLTLTAKEFVLLEFLVRRRGECCSRSELLSEVWQNAPEAGTNVVDVYVTYLRRKLAAAQREMSDIAQPSIIETVRGSGYRVRAVPVPAAAPTASLLPALREASSREAIFCHLRTFASR